MVFSFQTVLVGFWFLLWSSAGFAGELDKHHSYLNNIAQGNDDFSSSELTTLWTIALQCPLLGGDAVYKARSILSSLTDMYFEDYDDCTGTSALKAGAQSEKAKIAHTDRDKQQTAASFRVYPNPAKDKLNFVCENKQTNILQAELLNILGETVFSSELKNRNQSIDISRLPTGTYLLRIKDDKGNIIYSDEMVIIK
jgi:hypothetical protein